MANRKSISWILKYTSELPNREEKLKCLQANDGLAIRTVLKIAFDPKVKSALPEGSPPYIPNQPNGLENILYAEARRLYIFVENGAPNLNPVKRETMFIDLLQNMDPQDAELLIACLNKKFPYEGINKGLVEKAYPGIFF